MVPAKRPTFVSAVFIFFFLQPAFSDLPCRAREIEGQSIVCVCTADYCDTIERGETLLSGQFRVYTTSESGARFEKSEGFAQIRSSDFLSLIRPRVTINLNPDVEYQTIEGFGGSVTDAAGINILKLSPQAQEHLLRSYYSEEGLEYNMMRIPIGGCDFSTHPYTFNEYPENDLELTNYTLTSEDYDIKLPIIHRIFNLCTDEMKIIATTWSPPVWMKTIPRIFGFSQLRRAYFQTYADYHMRFLEEYEKEGVSIWALTTTNEPINGIVPIVRFNSMGWWPSTLSQWIVENMGPTLRNSKYNGTKLLAVDDQRYILPFVWSAMVSANASVLDYVDGLALHYYGNWLFPGDVLTKVHDAFPDKILVQTEACEGPLPWDEAKVILGSWRRAENYILDIIENLNSWVVSWLDWNLALDLEGGPNWADNFVDAPILVNDTSDEFYKNPMFYAMGHFTKFIPRGSVRIAATANSIFANPISYVALRRPDGCFVIVVYSMGTLKRTIEIRLPDGRSVETVLESKTVQTIEIQP